jgi:hypothetical protein
VIKELSLIWFGRDLSVIRELSLICFGRSLSVIRELSLIWFGRSLLVIRELSLIWFGRNLSVIRELMELPRKSFTHVLHHPTLVTFIQAEWIKTRLTFIFKVMRKSIARFLQ